MEASLQFAHFYAGMSLYMRAQAMLAVDEWVRAAAADGGRFFITLSALGVLRVVGHRSMSAGAYLRSEQRACLGNELVGVYEQVGLSADGLWLSDVWDDVCEALICEGLYERV